MHMPPSKCPLLTQQVRIYRLITNKTYERGMFERACLKLSLDQAVLGGVAAPGKDVTAASRTVHRVPGPKPEPRHVAAAATPTFRHSYPPLA